jgi:hypothetical protein
MDKILYVKKKNVYGNELVYPVCKDAKLFANLTKQKTLSTDDIARIKSLGYVFKHVYNNRLIRNDDFDLEDMFTKSDEETLGIV